MLRQEAADASCESDGLGGAFTTRAKKSGSINVLSRVDLKAQQNVTTVCLHRRNKVVEGVASRRAVTTVHNLPSEELMRR